MNKKICRQKWGHAPKMNALSDRFNATYALLGKTILINYVKGLNKSSCNRIYIPVSRNTLHVQLMREKYSSFKQHLSNETPTARRRRATKTSVKVCEGVMGRGEGMEEGIQGGEEGGQECRIARASAACIQMPRNCRAQKLTA